MYPIFAIKQKKALVSIAKQTIETVHSDFLNTWTNFKVSDTHPEYYNRLLKAVQKYNATHI